MWQKKSTNQTTFSLHYSLFNLHLLKLNNNSHESKHSVQISQHSGRTQIFNYVGIQFSGFHGFFSPLNAGSPVTPIISYFLKVGEEHQD